MLFISNGFSLNMLGENLRNYGGHIVFHRTDLYEVGLLIDSQQTINVIGHADIDRLVRDRLKFEGVNLEPGERVSVSLQEEDLLAVAQYVGPRLPEGTVTLPEGARIEWFLISYEHWSKYERT